MAKSSERIWRPRSKVTEGLRVKIPKDIADIYRVKKGDIVEWICDERGNIKIEIKEMVLREKKAKVEKEKDTSVMIGDENAKVKKAKVEKVSE